MKNNLTAFQDIYGKTIRHGDIIDIGQTVNGCNEFVIIDLAGNQRELKVIYNVEGMGIRFYEYDVNELLMVDLNTLEGPIVEGNIFDNPELFNVKIFG